MGEALKVQDELQWIDVRRHNDSDYDENVYFKSKYTLFSRLYYHPIDTDSDVQRMKRKVYPSSM